MSLKVIQCPNCEWARNVRRVDKHDVREIFPQFERGEMLDVLNISTRGVFYCADCGLEFSAEGQTFYESLGLVKKS